MIFLINHHKQLKKLNHHKNHLIYLLNNNNKINLKLIKYHHQKWGLMILLISLMTLIIINQIMLIRYKKRILSISIIIIKVFKLNKINRQGMKKKMISSKTSLSFIKSLTKRKLNLNKIIKKIFQIG